MSGFFIIIIITNSYIWKTYSSYLRWFCFCYVTQITCYLKVSAPPKCFVISALPATFRTNCVGTFITYVHTKFHTLSYKQLILNILISYECDVSTQSSRHRLLRLHDKLRSAVRDAILFCNYNQVESSKCWTGLHALFLEIACHAKCILTSQCYTLKSR